MNFSSLYAIGDPGVIGLVCDNGMNESCKEALPNETFPTHIEAECEGNLMFAAKDEPPCLLCKSNTSGRRSTNPKRRGWTKFIR